MSERTWWWRIGGPNAVTVWSWWVTLPLGLLTSVYGGLLAGVPLWPWVGAILVVHVVLIVPLVLIRATYLSSRPRRSRPVAAVLTFAALGAVRSLIMVGIAQALGVTNLRVIVFEWPIMGAVSSAFALSIIAIVVDSVREHRAATRRLLALQASLQQFNDLENARLADMEAAFLREVEERVLLALEDVRSRNPSTGQEAGRSLREVSEAVVRPLSHQLASAEPWAAPVPFTPPESWIRKVDGLLRLMGPVRSLWPTLIFEASVLPFMVARFGFALALVNFVAASVILYLLAVLVRRFWPEHLSPMLNVVGLAIVYAASLGIAGVCVSMGFILLGSDPPQFWTGFVVYPMLALAWSLLDAVLARRTELQEELADSLAREAQAADRLRARVASMQQRIAKILHSVVQGELVTSAVSLSRTDDPDAVNAEISRVSASIVERLHAEEVTTDSRERILDLLSLWSGALDVDVDVDEAVWTALNFDAALREAVIDVLAEGLTNAVRHGSGPAAHVVMRRVPAGVEVAIQSQGYLRPQGASGLGMQTIATSARSWTLEEHAGVVHLSVTLAS